MYDISALSLNHAINVSDIMQDNEASRDVTTRDLFHLVMASATISCIASPASLNPPAIEPVMAWIDRLSVGTVRVAGASDMSLLRADAPREDLAQLVDALHFGRRLVIYYNWALCSLILVCTVWHCMAPLRRRYLRRQNSGICRTTLAVDPDAKVEQGTGVASGSSSRSSSAASSTLLEDDERKPLLKRSHDAAGPRRSALQRAEARIRSWLMYQPPNLPILDRAMPTNLTTVVVLSFLGLNMFVLLFRINLPSHVLFLFAGRAGDLFAANLPLLYLLAAKNGPLLALTGASYEGLNIFHRRLGEWLCLLALLHLIGMSIIVYQLLDARGLTLGEILRHPLIWLGLAAFGCYETLFLTSLSSFRQKCYELFLASHIVLQAGGLAFLYFHFPTTRVWVIMALTIFAIDRIVYRAMLSRRTVEADLSVLPDGATCMISANWALPSRPLWWRRWVKRDVLTGWQPTNHVFVSVPALAHKHVLQAHPFTIASAAPCPSPNGSSSEAVPTAAPHAWLNLIIRARSGFSVDLLRYATMPDDAYSDGGGGGKRIKLRVDGPYGSLHALNLVREADTAVLVAGGSGIAVAFPMVWDLVMAARGRHGQQRKSVNKRVVLVWIVHSQSHYEWIGGRHVLDDLIADAERSIDGDGGVELEVVLPPPTGDQGCAGRPDVAALVEKIITARRGAGRKAAVVVSGPDGMNRAVRNECARLVGSEGVHVEVAVEKFGW